MGRDWGFQGDHGGCLSKGCIVDIVEAEIGSAGFEKGRSECLVDDTKAFAKERQIPNDAPQRRGQFDILDRELAKPYRIADSHLHALELPDRGSPARVCGKDGAVAIALGD